MHKERKKQLILPENKGQEDLHTENNSWIGSRSICDCLPSKNKEKAILQGNQHEHRFRGAVSPGMVGEML